MGRAGSWGGLGHGTTLVMAIIQGIAIQDRTIHPTVDVYWILFRVHLFSS